MAHLLETVQELLFDLLVDLSDLQCARLAASISTLHLLVDTNKLAPGWSDPAQVRMKALRTGLQFSSASVVSYVAGTDRFWYNAAWFYG